MIQHRRVIVISDLHLGRAADNDLDSMFRRLLRDIVPATFGSAEATLIINGDFIDFPRILPGLGISTPGPRFGSTEEVSLQKVDAALTAHPIVFHAIRQFIRDGGQVIVVPGNHDVDLFWDRVWKRVEASVGVDDDRLAIVSNGYISESRIYIEHGHQYAFDNRLNSWPNPILRDSDGTARLERPWGTFFMDTVYNAIEAQYPFLYAVRPRWKVACILARAGFQSERIIANTAARALQFLFAHSKTFMWERLLGDENVVNPPDSIGQWLSGLGMKPDSPEFIFLVDAIGRDYEYIDSSSEEVLTGRLLGHNDEQGIDARAIEILQSGLYDVAVFGHTHEAMDGNRNPPWGVSDSRRIFNTGSWMPVISIPRNDWPSLEDLRFAVPTRDVRYLVIDSGAGQACGHLHALD